MKSKYEKLVVDILLSQDLEALIKILNELVDSYLISDDYFSHSNDVKANRYLQLKNVKELFDLIYKVKGCYGEIVNDLIFDSLCVLNVFETINDIVDMYLISESYVNSVNPSIAQNYSSVKCILTFFDELVKLARLKK